MTAIKPDNDRLQKVLFLDGEPDRVPLWEHNIAVIHKTHLLGREPTSYQDEFEFWAAAGYDHMAFNAGFRYLVRSPALAGNPLDDRSDLIHTRISNLEKLFTTKTDKYAYDGGVTEREWAPMAEGLIANMQDLQGFPWPGTGDFDLTPFELAHTDLPEGLRVTACLGWNFTGAWWLMGMERFMVGIYEQPELVAALIDRISEMQHECLLHLLREHRAVLGAVNVLDDLAHVGGLMVSPELLRKHVFPWYCEHCVECRKAGLPVVFHTDGDVQAVIPDLIDCGFNALHPIEPQAMDIRALKREYGDRLCLLGNLDLAFPLGSGTPEDVRAEVKSLIEDCAPGGGLAVGSGNSVPEYVPHENYTTMLEAVFEFGRYPIGGELCT